MLRNEEIMLRNEEIYEALFDDDAFSALPNTLASQFGARSGLINWTSSAGNIENLAHSYFTHEFLGPYAARFVKTDPWQQCAFFPHRINTIFSAEDEVPQSAFRRSPVYVDLIKSIGDDTFHCMGGGFSTPWGMGAVGLNRAERAGPFTRNEVSALAAYAHNIRNVLMVRGELSGLRRSTALLHGILDAFATAALVITANMRVLYLNAAAESIITLGDAMKISMGLLTARDAEGQSRLNAAVHNATLRTKPATANVTLNRFTTSVEVTEPYFTSVTPLASQGISGALLVFRDPAAVLPGHYLELQRFFGLTRAEAKIAIALSKGHSTAQIAEHRGASEATVRGQIKAIAAKIGVSRQSAIAVAVARIPPIRSV